MTKPTPHLLIRSIFSPLRLFLCGVACCLLAATSRADPVEFDLPAQPAADALLAFSQQSGIDVLFSSDELRGKTSNALRGRYEPEEALAVLLRGTEFTARRKSKGKYVVTRTVPLNGSAQRPLTCFRTAVLPLASGLPSVPCGNRPLPTKTAHSFFHPCRRALIVSSPPGRISVACANRRGENFSSRMKPHWSRRSCKAPTSWCSSIHLWSRRKPIPPLTTPPLPSCEGRRRQPRSAAHGETTPCLSRSMNANASSAAAW